MPHRNIRQCLVWLNRFLPGDEKLYILLLADIIWSIWTTGNKITFEIYVVKSPKLIIYTAASLMGYWVGLYADVNA